MLSRKFMEFLNDERGTYTLWSLVWFMLYVALGGLAVDVTDAYRVQTQLQATADAAALAGVMSLGTLTQDPVEVAIRYAEVNMKPEANGPVLRDVDVLVGTWQFASETFRPNTTEPNAVYVRTRRDSQNDNQLAMNFLLILQGMGLRPSWNLGADAVAVVGVNECLNEGLIAYEDLLFNPHTNFFDYICLVGHQGFSVASQGSSLPTFDDTVYAGAGCTAEEGCVGPGSNPWNNPDFMNAFDSTGPGTGNFDDPTLPLNAMRVGDYIETLRSWADPADNVYDDLGSFDNFVAATREEFSADFSGWNYLADTGSGAWRPDYQQISAQDFAALAAQPDPLAPYTVYEITSCTQAQTFDFPQGTYDHVAIITGCQINFAQGTYDITNSLIATTATSGGSGNGQQAISAGPNADISLGTNCTNGVEIYSMGNVHMASGADVAGSRILADGNVHFAAKANGYAGIHIEAMGNIDPASGSNSQSDWGLCDGIAGKGPMVLTYVLVR